MLHEILIKMDFSTWTQLGLVSFMTIYVGVVIWTFTRRKGDISHWSSLPIESDSGPIFSEPTSEETR